MKIKNIIICMSSCKVSAIFVQFYQKLEHVDNF
jgi:hypothetical protein